MVTYRVFDRTWGESYTFTTEEAARLFIEKQVDIYPDCSYSDFIIYKQEEIKW